MRKVFVAKLKQKIEEGNRVTALDAVSGQDQADKSFDAEDLNKTGEMSKLSNKDESARRSKERTAEQPESVAADKLQSDLSK